ncbi:mannose-1-phosphate guanylyltransferase/mannose-6-phosphate isomerase [Methyloceanibacter sp. wino2]|uniref:mannose-1-phosphate guanylyltransferase/mannose-6-phosphate isomerase n=1 Tax=Methyloceanibacter sp. wino2 TaxID=2170729 RepID=UPI000D3E94F4|nr:mannose-1-phosphate guanylyltransferase/mannose-6-phosphate isomerase [Methyloceanibacter sp. wino2]
MARSVPVIMCGGAGTRVWPESRETLPKQFIPLVGEQSTFQRLVTMLGESGQFDRPLVVTNQEYRFLVAEQLEQCGLEATIVLEPERRDSGPAVAVAAALAAKGGPNMIVSLFAADHVYEKPEAFLEACDAAVATARQGYVTSFGIKPTFPATGFGYIQPGDPIGDAGAHTIAAFVEKPDEETARRYVAEGYLWNSGNFVFPAELMRSEIARFEPEMAEAVDEAVEGAKSDLGFVVLDPEAFGRATKKSIDYAVMERTDRAAVVEADVGWSDLGTWNAVQDFLAKDEHGNSARGDVLLVDCENVHVRSEETLTAVVGIKDAVVVTTPDAVLVLNSNEADKVKALVETLRQEKRREIVEHRRVYRPWGYYQGVDEGVRHQVKRILVRPGGRLSLQKHFHRAEHWIVVKGTAEVTRDNEVMQVHENESVYLPIGCTHRLANPGKIDLELIEVQTGSYLGEDDIIRIEDIYNRN